MKVLCKDIGIGMRVGETLYLIYSRGKKRHPPRHGCAILLNCPRFPQDWVKVQIGLPRPHGRCLPLSTSKDWILGVSPPSGWADRSCVDRVESSDGS